MFQTIGESRHTIISIHPCNFVSYKGKCDFPLKIDGGNQNSKDCRGCTTDQIKRTIKNTPTLNPHTPRRLKIIFFSVTPLMTLIPSLLEVEALTTQAYPLSLWNIIDDHSLKRSSFERKFPSLTWFRNHMYTGEQSWVLFCLKRKDKQLLQSQSMFPLATI